MAKKHLCESDACLGIRFWDQYCTNVYSPMYWKVRDLSAQSSWGLFHMDWRSNLRVFDYSNFISPTAVVHLINVLSETRITCQDVELYLERDVCVIIPCPDTHQWLTTKSGRLSLTIVLSGLILSPTRVSDKGLFSARIYGRVFSKMNHFKFQLDFKRHFPLRN